MELKFHQLKIYNENPTNMIIETTKFFKDIRFRWFQDHDNSCKAAIKNNNYDNLIRCDCRVYFKRITRWWYRPIEKIFKKIEHILYKRLGRFNKYSSYIRKKILLN